MAKIYPVRVCRIGNATALIVLGSDGAASISLNGREASRLFMARAGHYHLAFANFPAVDLEAGPVSLGLGEQTVAATIDASLVTVIMAMRLDRGQTAQLLHLLAGTVSKLFRLQSDPILSEFLIAARSKLAMPTATMMVHAVAGYGDAVLRFSGDAKLTPETIFLGVCGGKDGASRHELNLQGRMKLGDFRLAYAGLPCAAADLTGVLVVDRQQLIWFSVAVDNSASAVKFHDTHMGTTPEAVALLQRHAGSALRRDLLAVQARQRAPRKMIELSGLPLCFSVEVLQAFEEGVFVSGWLLDPNRNFRDAQIVDYSLRQPALQANWHVYDGFAEINGEVTAVRGFCAFAKRKRRGDVTLSPAIRLNLRDGSSSVCRAAAASGDGRQQRDAILSVVHSQGLEGGALQDAYQPALLAVARRLAPASPVRKTDSYGRRSSRKVSIVIPLYGDLRFMRSQLLAFAADPDLRQTAQVIFVLDDPRLRREAQLRIGGLARITGLDITLVQMSVNSGYGAATNAGADIATGAILVLMNSDVVPVDGGWLQQMRDRLRNLPPQSIVGPKLLYADDSLQHAGMYFYRLPNGVFQNMHYFKGYGRHFEPANVAREVPAVTGAVMVLGRDAFLTAGGFSSDYVIGDYEDSDLCLKLRAHGGRCFYVPEAELYHFERQSMTAHPSAGENGSTAYNRQLHHERWAQDIAALMANKDFSHDANAY